MLILTCDIARILTSTQVVRDMFLLSHAGFSRTRRGLAIPSIAVWLQNEKVEPPQAVALIHKDLGPAKLPSSISLYMQGLTCNYVDHFSLFVFIIRSYDNT